MGSGTSDRLSQLRRLKLSVRWTVADPPKRDCGREP